jgi:hypothetical protein
VRVNREVGGVGLVLVVLINKVCIGGAWFSSVKRSKICCYRVVMIWLFETQRVSKLSIVVKTHRPQRTQTTSILHQRSIYRRSFTADKADLQINIPAGGRSQRLLLMQMS